MCQQGQQQQQQQRTLQTRQKHTKKIQNQHFITHAWSASGLRCHCYPILFGKETVWNTNNVELLTLKGNVQRRKPGRYRLQRAAWTKTFPLCLGNSAKIKANKVFLSKHTVDPALAATKGAVVNAPCVHRWTVHFKPCIVVGMAAPVGSTCASAAQDSTDLLRKD